MQLSGISNTNVLADLKKLMADLQTPPANPSGQDLPTAPADGQCAPPAASQMAPTTVSNRFAADTLSSLLSLQQTSSNDLANKLIGKVDGDGDGSLSLAEIESTLSGAPKSASGAAASDPLAQAFASLDTDGDGKLNASELSSALDTLKASHHHHHHRHAGPASVASGETAPETAAANSATPTASSEAVAAAA